MNLSINPHVAQMRPSKTLAISARARELQREGKPVIALSAGEPDFPTPRIVSEAGMTAIQDGHTTYTDVAGLLSLRQRIARKLESENGVRYTADEILCCNGAKQAVSQAILALCSPGDEVLIPAPYWVSYPDMTLLAGAVPRFIHTTAESNYRTGPAELERHITDRTRILILCSPSNPTGSVYPRAELEAIADVVRKHDYLFVLSDEIYERIVFGVEHVCFASLPGMWEKTITVNGFSKAFAMTGWRLGYMAAPEPVIRAAKKIQSQTTSGPSNISQHAGIKALELDSETVDAMIGEFQWRRDYLLEMLAEIPGIVCPKPDGAFYLFPDVSAFYGTVTPDGVSIVDSESLCLYLLETCYVALVPGSAFGDDNGLRISYAASRTNLQEAMRRISSGLAALRKSAA
ncbi:MAG TPA: pyridoxal phosphate-dependent aminotransferase [Rhodothermales bacterium]|nr:pyridoxal phosphate-dependent aminotransferase [Rhodothermales bacterium]